MLKAGDRVMVMSHAEFRKGEIGRVKWINDNRVWVNSNEGEGCLWESELAQLPYPKEPLTPERWRAMNGDGQRTYVAEHNICLARSCGAADETTCGFGELDDNGYFEFPCGWAITSRIPSPKDDEFEF